MLNLVRTFTLHAANLVKFANGLRNVLKRPVSRTRQQSERA